MKLDLGPAFPYKTREAWARDLFSGLRCPKFHERLSARVRGIKRPPEDILYDSMENLWEQIQIRWP